MRYFSRVYDPLKGVVVGVKNYATEKLGRERQLVREHTPEEVARFKAFADLLVLREGQQLLRYLDSKIAELKNQPRDLAGATAETLFRHNISIEARSETLTELRDERATAEEKLTEGEQN